LGGILGYERERKEKPAGFRTHMIIAGASALLLILGQQIAVGTFIDLSDTALGIDPTRIIHAIIVGVSFIGAGTVLKSREKTEIYYLTTAATLLMSSAIGICVGMHLYVMAIGTTILTLLVNTLLRRFDK
jgi:putative Mg2+ transporter-C (MgtC) family protein